MQNHDACHTQSPHLPPEGTALLVAVDAFCVAMNKISGVEYFKRRKGLLGPKFRVVVKNLSSAATFSEALTVHCNLAGAPSLWQGDVSGERRCRKRPNSRVTLLYNSLLSG